MRALALRGRRLVLEKASTVTTVTRVARRGNNGCMKRTLLPATVGFLIVLLINSGGCLYRYRSSTCKQREAALREKEATLKREAHEKLKVGAKKDAVIRFFA